jgi:endo-1,4-beta-xylanase
MKTTTLTAFLLLFVPAVLGLLDPKIKAKGKKYFGSAADPGTIGVAIDVTILTSDYGAYTPENRSVCYDSLWGYSPAGC